MLNILTFFIDGLNYKTLTNSTLKRPTLITRGGITISFIKIHELFVKFYKGERTFLVFILFNPHLQCLEARLWADEWF